MDEHHHDHSHAHVHFDTPEVAAQAELEGEVLAGFVTQAVAAVAEQAERHGVDVRRVVDLGSGPGVGTALLAERFGAATVVAADGSAAMLERAAARVDRLGLGDRVEVQHVELPDGIDAVGRADVAWASMALHHVGDEVDALRRIRSVLEPGGLLALLEHAEPLRIVVEGGDPDLWARLDAAATSWFADMRAGLPGAKASADPRSMVEAAGFEVLVDEVLSLRLDAPLDVAARRFAHEHLARVESMLEGYVDAADVEAVRTLAAEDRDDIAIEATRHLVVARAPLS